MKSPMTTLCYVEKDDSYLMLHRVKKEKDVNKDKWIGIGGHFEQGESPEECLLREAREETGLTLTSWQFRGLVTFTQEGYGTEYMCLYTADGYEGSINHGMTDITEETIDIMDWVSNEECNDQDLEEVLSKLIKIYGDYSKIEDSNYADMDKSYQWMNVDGYEWVICGLTSEGKILIRWMI